MPIAGRPVGHIRRGSTSTPGRPRAARAASRASRETSAVNRAPAQLSQRPQGAASSSSSWRRRYSMRHIEVVAYSRIACCSALRCRSTHAYRSVSYVQGRPVAVQPPRTRCTAPSTSRTLSMVSSRLRRRSTLVSSAGTDIGPRRRPGSPGCAAPVPHAGRRARRSSARSPRPLARGATAPPRGRHRARRGPPAGSRRWGRRASPGAPRSPGPVCRNPCRAPRWRPAP